MSNRPHSSATYNEETIYNERQVRSDYGIRNRKIYPFLPAFEQPKRESRKSSPRKLYTPSISLDAGSSNDLSSHRKPFTRCHSVPPDSKRSSEFEISDFAEKAQFVTEQIHRLAKAFLSRADSVKQRLTQPPTPSTDGSTKGEGPLSPPPLTTRLAEDSLTALYDLKAGLKPWYLRLHKIRFPKVIDSQGWFYIWWLSILSIAFTYNSWVIPYRLCFTGAQKNFFMTWMTVDYLCDAIYLADMIIFKSRIRFLREGFWVETRRDMMANYVRSFAFKVDLLCILPFDVLYIFLGTNAVYVRIFRVLKIGSFWELFDRLDVVLASPFLVRVGRALLYMIFLIHLNACAYYALSMYEGIAATEFVLQTRRSEYLRCFYFALKTATKIGKNPPPVNDKEYTFMIFNWIIGVFACAALIGQIRDIISAKERNETQYRELLDRVSLYMHRIHLPAQLQDKVKLWFTFNWEQQKSLEEGSSLRFLPVKLRTDVALDVHIHTLSKVQLFHDCDSSILRELVLKLKPVLFLPGDYVCKKGEVGREMYIVQTGQLEVMGGPDGKTVLVTLYEGSVFGEISLLAIGGGNRRTADVRSKGFSNLFVLDKKDLYDAIRDYPETQQILQKKALKVMKQNATKQKKLYEDSDSHVIISGWKSTPRLLEAVLKILPQESGASQLLRYGSRATLASSFPSRSLINSPPAVRSQSPLVVRIPEPMFTFTVSDSLSEKEEDKVIVVATETTAEQESSTAVIFQYAQPNEGFSKQGSAESRRSAFAALFHSNRVSPLQTATTPRLSMEPIVGRDTHK